MSGRSSRSTLTLTNPLVHQGGDLRVGEHLPAPSRGTSNRCCTRPRERSAGSRAEPSRTPPLPRDTSRPGCGRAAAGRGWSLRPGGWYGEGPRGRKGRFPPPDCPGVRQSRADARQAAGRPWGGSSLTAPGPPCSTRRRAGEADSAPPSRRARAGSEAGGRSYRPGQGASALRRAGSGSAAPADTVPAGRRDRRTRSAVESGPDHRSAQRRSARLCRGRGAPRSWESSTTGSPAATASFRKRRASVAAKPMFLLSAGRSVTPQSRYGW